MGNTSASHANLRNATPAYASNTVHLSEPMLFHNSHSSYVQLSVNSRRATRVDSFCQGVCFGSRPVDLEERVHLSFVDITTNWSGVLRFGLTHRDPAHITCADLPRYVCPELTNLPGFWARAIPDSVALIGTVLTFYLTRHGDIMYCINGAEQGVFLSGVETSSPCWPLLDIYGNTISVEFVDGISQNNPPYPLQQNLPFVLEPQAIVSSQNQQNWNNQNHHPSYHQLLPTSDLAAHPPNPPVVADHMTRHRSFRHHQVPSLAPDFGPYTKLCFHKTIGRNICLSPDHAIAVRLKHEFCSGYVFSERPVLPGETLVIQLLSVVLPSSGISGSEFGGLAFGMTSCDPAFIKLQELPDDSDFLLDRPEYWVVNKDVNSTQPNVGDRLSFYFTTSGEIRFSKNNYYIGTLMHVDHSLPLWMFFDVFGNTQKIKLLGIVITESPLVVVLPPTRPPTRPPSLPPKEYNTLRLYPQHSHFEISGYSTYPPAVQTQYKRPSLPPPLIPTPVNQMNQCSAPASSSLLPTNVAAATVAPAPIKPPKSPVIKRQVLPPPRPSSPPHFMPPLPPEDEEADEDVVASNRRSQQLETAVARLRISMCSEADHSPTEPPPPSAFPSPPSPTPSSSSSVISAPPPAECSVCLENTVNCVLYTCGHMCLCYECAGNIKASAKPLCPVCRSVIKDVIRTFRS